jgi:hypothetical protein
LAKIRANIPPGGFDRAKDPFNFWILTLMILSIGIFPILIYQKGVDPPLGLSHG